MKRVQEIGDGKLDEEENLAIESVKVVKGKIHEMCLAWYENVEICNNSIKFKLDTGAQVNVIPHKLLRKLRKIELEKTNVILEAFGG